jgi:hypothetical protein
VGLVVIKSVSLFKEYRNNPEKPCRRLKTAGIIAAISDFPIKENILLSAGLMTSLLLPEEIFFRKISRMPRIVLKALSRDEPWHLGLRIRVQELKMSV